MVAKNTETWSLKTCTKIITIPGVSAFMMNACTSVQRVQMLYTPGVILIKWNKVNTSYSKLVGIINKLISIIYNIYLSLPINTKSTKTN